MPRNGTAWGCSATAALPVAMGCEGATESGGGCPAAGDVEITGTAQKGPLLSGSELGVALLDDRLW